MTKRYKNLNQNDLGDSTALREDLDYCITFTNEILKKIYPHAEKIHTESDRISDFHSSLEKYLHKSLKNIFLNYQYLLNKEK